MPKVTVAIAGGFDPVHDGHWDHIQKAYHLGDWLYIITHPDEIMVRKKGICFTKLDTRVAILKGLLLLLGGNGQVVISIDSDGSVAKTLEKLRPTIFAKGGDRIASNMPVNELEVCQRIGCEIRYGVGDLLNSSSKIIREWIRAHEARNKQGAIHI